MPLCLESENDTPPKHPSPRTGEGLKGGTIKDGSLVRVVLVLEVGSVSGPVSGGDWVQCVDRLFVVKIVFCSFLPDHRVV